MSQTVQFNVTIPFGTAPPPTPVGQADVAESTDRSVITLGDDVTLTYTVKNASRAFLGGDMMPGLPRDLIADGQQHTYVYTPTRSGPFPLCALDTQTPPVLDGLPVSVIVKRTLPALDPASPIARTTVRTGAFDDPATWGGTLPGRDDTCLIAAGHIVTATGRLDADEVGRLLIDGTLSITAGVLYATRIHVRPGGTLEEIGPDTANKALCILVNRPKHVNDVADSDRMLLIEGTLRTRGATVTPFVRLAAEPHAGDGTLTLASPVVGWNTLNKLLLHDTRQVGIQYVDGRFLPPYQPPYQPYNSQHEIVTIRGVDGLKVYLPQSRPLAHDHLAARDKNNAITFYPVLANLIRTTGFVTEDPTDQPNRSCMMVTGTATLDLQGSIIHGMGRATNDADTVPGNYHEHCSFIVKSLRGPAGGVPCSDGQNHAWRVEDCVILDPTPIVADSTARWGFCNKDSSDGFFKGNIVYNWMGAGVVAALTGSEHRNVFEGNLVCKIFGTGSRGDGDLVHNPASEGTAFWVGQANNRFRGNFAANCATMGYFFLQVGPQNSVLEFVGNEVCGASRGLTIWSVGASVVGTFPVGNSLVKDFHAWHCNTHNYSYMTNNVTFDGMVVRGDRQVWQNTIGVYFGDYMTHNNVVKNSDVQGCRWGVLLPSKAGDTLDTGQQLCVFTLQDSYICCLWDLECDGLFAVTGGYESLPPTQHVIRNVTFDRPLDTFGGQPYDIVMTFPAGRSKPNLVTLCQVLVYAFNGDSTNNFQVYFKEQAADWVLTADAALNAYIGAAEVWQTNQQNWDQHQTAMAGAVAPATAVPKPNIARGLVQVI